MHEAERIAALTDLATQLIQTLTDLTPAIELLGPHRTAVALVNALDTGQDTNDALSRIIGDTLDTEYATTHTSAKRIAVVTDILITRLHRRFIIIERPERTTPLS